jgi:L-ascorbate metabolism protein UlaG (beta-lactamase superfamily)
MTLTAPAAADAVTASAGDGITFIGTATVLIRALGFTILTDPNFLHRGEEAHLGYALRSARLTDPAMDIADLPPLDLVVLSHLHGDHFDQVAERDLDHALPILTTPQAAAGLKRKGFANARGLRTWESETRTAGPATLTLTALPARHGPPVLHRMLPATMGSLLDLASTDGERRLRLYISGDTLVFEGLREIGRRFPVIDIGLLHLGGTRIGGLTLTMDGEQGVEAMRIVGPRRVVPIHYDDYDVFRSPLEDFRRACGPGGLRDRVVELQRGETLPLQP